MANIVMNKKLLIICGILLISSLVVYQFLEMKVIPQLQITVAIPGDFVYDKHEEWILKSIYGKPAVFWPWEAAPYGYIVNKSHPELIKFITETVVPYWIERWGVDGIYLDSSTMGYCDLRIKNLCENTSFKCLTPVKGYYSPELLVKAIKDKLRSLEEKTGKNLIFSAELSMKTWQDVPNSTIIKVCNRKAHAYQFDPKVDRSLGKYFDWVLGYSFRDVLNDVYNKGYFSYSENYVEFLKKN